MGSGLYKERGFVAESSSLRRRSGRRRLHEGRLKRRRIVADKLGTPAAQVLTLLHPLPFYLSFWKLTAQGVKSETDKNHNIRR